MLIKDGEIYISSTIKYILKIFDMIMDLETPYELGNSYNIACCADSQKSRQKLSYFKNRAISF